MLEWLIPIVAASVGATISGTVLLFIHHNKVKQEIDLQRRKEQFEKKQKLYRAILQQVNSLLDFSAYLGSRTNWRIDREVYNQLILVASIPVVEELNKCIKSLDQDDGEVLTSSLKSLLRAIREDLYGDTLADKDLRIYSPPIITMDSLQLYANNVEKLKKLGLDSYDRLGNMDIDVVHASANIPKDDLKKIKEMGEREARIEREFDQFLGR
jgi:hypothetical protein